MTVDIITAVGEEYCIKNALGGTTVTWGLYNDSSDGVTDSSYDPSNAISTEPNNSNYSRETVTMNVAQTSSDVWGVQNDAALSFDFSDTGASDSVDALFATVSFDSDYAGGSGSWLIATAGLVNEHTVGNVNSIDLSVGDLEINYS